MMNEQIHEVGNAVIWPLLLNPLAEYRDDQASPLEVDLFVP